MLSFSHIVDELDDRSKVGWTIKVDILYRVLVSFHNSVQSIYLGVKDVAIQGETVRGSVRRWGYRSTKAEYWDLLVRVIILQNIPN